MKLNTAQLKMLKTLANYTETSPMPCGYQVAGPKGTVKLNQPTWAALQSRGLVASRGQAGVDLVKWITEEGRREFFAAASDILLKELLADAIKAGDTEQVFHLDNEFLRRGVWR